MDQDQYKEGIKETFNVSLEDKEILPVKKKHKT